MRIAQDTLLSDRIAWPSLVFDYPNHQYVTLDQRELLRLR
jgi:hypothetical protein